MLNLQEIEETIADLEAGKTTMSACSNLADLLRVRDHIIGREPSEITQYSRGYSRAAEPQPIPQTLDLYGNSDFLRVVADKDAAGAWAIIDDLMSTLEVVNRRLYDSYMRKFDRL